MFKKKKKMPLYDECNVSHCPDCGKPIPPPGRLVYEGLLGDSLDRLASLGVNCTGCGKYVDYIKRT